jgi:hypothetical protein
LTLVSFALDGKIMRRNITILTGLAATLVMLGGMSTASSAFAMGCINPKLAPSSLAQDVRPDDQHSYDQVAMLGNKCVSTTQQVPATTTKINASMAAQKPLAKAKTATY